MIGKIIAAIVAFLAGLFGGGATPAPSEVPGPTPDSGLYVQTSGDDAELIGDNLDVLWGTWQSTTEDLVTLTFTQQEQGIALRADAGCNLMNASATVSDSRLIVGETQSTLMSCPETDDLEAELTKLIAANPRLVLGGDGTLYLELEDGASAPFTKQR